MCHQFVTLFFFFFNDTATTEIYTLSLHDALPISGGRGLRQRPDPRRAHRDGVPLVGVPPLRLPARGRAPAAAAEPGPDRSEEHTSELQSRQYLVCRLLLEKKKKIKIQQYYMR